MGAGGRLAATEDFRDGAVGQAGQVVVGDGVSLFVGEAIQRLDEVVVVFGCRRSRRLRHNVDRDRQA